VDRAGALSNERVLIAKTDGVPNGVTVDEKGNLWVPAAGIGIYSPEGKRLHLIESHDAASACTFGEADNKTLFLTARAIVLRARHEGQ
jgi:gluconolactonase